MPKVEEAAEILRALGLPQPQTNERSALTLLALAKVPPDGDWARAEQPLLRTVDIMAFMREVYGKDYKPNSRETIRRQTLHQFVDARVADLNPDDPARPTNSGNNCYALTHAVLPVVRAYGADQFARRVEAFIANQGRLRDLYRRQREMAMVPVKLPSGRKVRLSPGPHNELQRAVIEQFAPRFAPGAVLLYLGDAAKKHLVFEKEALAALSIPITEHDKLPDVVLYREDEGWIYLIEAVTSHGPVSPSRQRQLEELLADCDAAPIFVSAFPDRADFRRYAADIAWETEVWFASDPEHLVHFNGEKFLGPLLAEG